MKNGEQPVTPTIIFDSGENSFTQTKHLGLTKREHFASLAMQGLLASTQDIYSSDNIVLNSIRVADKLLKALEETNEQ